MAIITGSGQGLGKGFAARLLNAGAKVCTEKLLSKSVFGELCS